MASPYGERAIEDAINHGIAILKFISANDVGLTKSHQAGYYLPKPAWKLFSPHPPEKGVNSEHDVIVTWQDGRETKSKVKWYGQGTRSEYRLTRFGYDFPYRTFDNLGDLLVIIPKSVEEFLAYVLDTDEDIEEIQERLGIEIIRSWAVYGREVTEPVSEDKCLNRHFRKFAETVDQFPEVKVFSEATQQAILDCVKGFSSSSVDEQLLRLIREEYNLFRMVERKIFQPEVQRLFASIDDFIQTALSILQARRSRAGRSLENHVEYLLNNAAIPFEMRPIVDGTRPDIIIPSKAAYDDPNFPVEKLFMIGVKTTCKDRWRQVTREAPRIERKHILTLQPGISSTQLQEMRLSKVELVVPKPLHKEFPVPSPINIFSINQFIEQLKLIYP